MHANAFDHFQAGHSLVHRLDPRIKTAAVLLFILSNLLLPDAAWGTFLLTWVFLLACTRLAGLPFRFILTRSFLALPFALAAVTAAFTLPGQPVFAIRLGPVYLVATAAGLARFGSIMLRSWLSIQGAILLTATTQFPDLVHALRHLRVPAVLTAILSFMYRYLFVLTDEVLRLLRAREARSAALPGQKGGGNLAWRARIAGNMAGQLFLRSYERSDRIYNAMLARGYRGELLTMNPHILRPLDWAALAAVVLALASLQLFARL